MLGDVVRRLVWAESKDIRRDDPVPSCRLVSENDCDTGHSVSPAFAIYLLSSSIPFRRTHVGWRGSCPVSK